jgi:hypothetical protein
MPTPQDIQILFKEVLVKDDSDPFGSGEFRFIAEVDHKPVGDPDHEFDAIEGKTILLPPADWTSQKVDVRGKSDVKISFKGIDVDVFWDDELGSVTHTLRPPWKQGIQRRATKYFILTYEVVLGVRGAFTHHPPDAVFSARQAGGLVDAMTVSGHQRILRAEIHPVVPLPTAGLPPRPVMPVGTPAAITYTTPTNITAASPINVIPNPAVIPILTAASASASTAAQIQLSYVQPGNWTFAGADTVEWKATTISGSPGITFVGPAEGRQVLVYGTGVGEVLLEARLRDAVVATYRALVDKVRQIPCRFNILNGATANARPRSTPADVQTHVAIANRFLRQIGLELVFDTNITTTNHAVASAIPGIFTISVANGVTRNTNGNTAVRLNHRAAARILNFAYVRSDASTNLGVAMFNPASNAGATITDRGTPSTSWISPTGVPPDGAAGAVTMRLGGAFNHATIPNLTAMYVTDTNGNPTSPIAQMTYAGTIAHEVCHLLNLNHRVENPVAPPFDDGVNYPPNENVMHWNNPTSIAQDFDIIQAKAVRQSPMVPP